jgi:glycosyltransferase involved in cell wall biosynthesis
MEADRTCEEASLGLRPASEMRVAIVHYWLVGMRGGERVLEALCRLFPHADIFTHAYAPERISDVIRGHRVQTTFVDRLPWARRLHQLYLPLMPRALEALDLTQYDLVLSSESGPAKGVIAAPEALHVCYVHSPMRYLWDQFHVYRDQASPIQRLAMDLFFPALRIWDHASAARVDAFVANSAFVGRRIDKYYRRPSRVVYPPVAVNDFAPVPLEEREAHYLLAGELVSYKRPELAVQAAAQLGRRLVVVGEGSALPALRRQASADTTFLGRVPFEQLRWQLGHCRALLFPGTEDFGILPVEAQACGTPVIAHRSGGARETVLEGRSGMFFEAADATSLASAIERFEAASLLAPEAIAQHAARFDEGHFRAGIAEVLAEHGVGVEA